MGDTSTFAVVSIIGDECALVISGAVRALAEDRARRWVLENGERLRDRIDNVTFPVKFDSVSDAGSVDRRGVGGLTFAVSDSRAPDVFGGSSRFSGRGEDISAGGGSVRGTIFGNVLCSSLEGSRERRW